MNSRITLNWRKSLFETQSLSCKPKLFLNFEPLDEDATNAANQFLFSVLTNDKFIKWLENYQNKLINQYNRNATLPTKKQSFAGIRKRIIENGDPKILSDLLDTSPKTIDTIKLF